MIVTVDIVKELIRDNVAALDIHVKMYEELNEERFKHMPKSIGFGKKALNGLLQHIELLEQLPEIPDSNNEQFQLVEGKKPYVWTLPITNDDP